LGNRNTLEVFSLSDDSDDGNKTLRKSSAASLSDKYEPAQTANRVDHRSNYSVVDDQRHK